MNIDLTPEEAQIAGIAISRLPIAMADKAYGPAVTAARKLQALLQQAKGAPPAPPAPPAPRKKGPI